MHRQKLIIGVRGGQAVTIDYLLTMCHRVIMTHSLRIDYSCPLYNITFRGNERKTIFQNDVDRHTFLVIT